MNIILKKKHIIIVYSPIVAIPNCDGLSLQSSGMCDDKMKNFKIYF